MIVKSPQAEPELVLRFDNELPVQAAELARVLRDLAADYKRIYSDELIVVGVPEGSLIARLRSASEFAKEANHILDFGLKLGALAAMGLGLVALNQKAQSGADEPFKSMESLARTAVRSGSTLEVRYVTSEKAEVLISVTPQEARIVEGAVKARRLSETPKPPQIDYTAPIALPGAQDSSRGYDALKARLSDMGGSGRGVDALDPEVRSLIVALVLALNEAAPFRIEQLTRELEMDRHHDAAQLVRSIVADDSGTPQTRLRLPQ